MNAKAFFLAFLVLFFIGKHQPNIEPTLFTYFVSSNVSQEQLMLNAVSLLVEHAPIAFLVVPKTAV